MARKRMFDREIVNKDKFCDMPMSSKALYFLLGMEADDYGFVSPRRVMRTHGATDDDLKLLILKEYVIPFETGVVVIVDWHKNNYIDKNKIQPTEYLEEQSLVHIDNGKYCASAVKLKLNQSLTEVKQKLTQSSIEQNSAEKNSINYIDELFEKIWKLLPPHVNDRKSKVSKKRKEELYDYGYDRVESACKKYLETQPKEYLHKRDNFFNEVINNYLDDEVEVNKVEQEYIDVHYNNDGTILRVIEK